jgi:hypothetical protein
MKLLRSFSWVAFLGAAALSGCDYFSNVVIPATDTTPPYAVSGVYDIVQNQYVALGATGDSLDKPALKYRVTDPTETYMAVGATVDLGGAKSVHVWGQFVWWCRDSHGTEGLEPGPIVGSNTATQNGNVGDTVSDGVWTYLAVRFDQVEPANGCAQNGWTYLYTKFYWFTTSEDFHGNKAYSTGEMDYYGP